MNYVQTQLAGIQPSTTISQDSSNVIKVSNAVNGNSADLKLDLAIVGDEIVLTAENGDSTQQAVTKIAVGDIPFDGVSPPITSQFFSRREYRSKLINVTPQLRTENFNYPITQPLNILNNIGITGSKNVIILANNDIEITADIIKYNSGENTSDIIVKKGYTIQAQNRSNTNAVKITENGIMNLSYVITIGIEEIKEAFTNVTVSSEENTGYLLYGMEDGQYNITIKNLLLSIVYSAPGSTQDKYVLCDATYNAIAEDNYIKSGTIEKIDNIRWLDYTGDFKPVTEIKQVTNSSGTTQAYAYLSEIVYTEYDLEKIS